MEDQNNKQNETGEVNIQPSQTEKDNANPDSKKEDPGRTPGKAEGSEEIVEDNLRQKNLDKNS